MKMLPKALPATSAGLISAIMPAQAETVSQKEALARAGTFCNAAYGQVMSQPKLVYNGKRLTTRSLFIPFYVYNLPAGGFVIMSAENKAFPVLGYSLTENFNPELIDSRTEALLRSYARDIELIRYDSNIPDEAIHAWTHYPENVDALLKAPNDATDPTITAEEAARAVENVVDLDDASLSSVTYTPAQWADAINDELAAKGSAARGIYRNGEFIPTVVHGRRGDYYRLTLDGDNKALYRLFATEILNQGEIAALGNPNKAETQEEPDNAFRFHEEFVAETRARERERQRAIEEALAVKEPKALRLGGGHFELRTPENVGLVRIYNIAGDCVRQYRFHDTASLPIDISPEPAGIYFCLMQGDSGKVYGVKIAR